MGYWALKTLSSTIPAQTFRCRKVNLIPAFIAKRWRPKTGDAPVIVTTAVQFFESLYGNRASRCRKLHNIAGSVVVFDEAQTMPVPYLRPCVAAVGQLVQYYGVTAVLCTATQPALQPLFDVLAPGLKMREICPDIGALYKFFRRTNLQQTGELTAGELTAQLCAVPQALCVVNRRSTAQQLFAALPAGGRYCLTTLLCPADRKRLLKEIRARLKDGLPCRVVSTSLIEAGVDVDFPAAWREEAGLDSILQTAGRCNREGKKTGPRKHCHGVPLKRPAHACYDPPKCRFHPPGACAVCRSFHPGSDRKLFFVLPHPERRRRSGPAERIIRFQQGPAGKVLSVRLGSGTVSFDRQRHRHGVSAGR